MECEGHYKLVEKDDRKGEEELRDEGIQTDVMEWRCVRFCG